MEMRKEDGKMKLKKAIGILTIVLWILTVGYKFLSHSEGLLRYAPVGLILVVLPVALFLQGRLLNVFKKEGVTHADRDLRRALAFFLGATTIIVGELLGTLITERALTGFSIGGITIFFLYLSVLLLLRTGLLKLWYEIGKNFWKERAWRLAAGYADLSLIIAHGAVFLTVRGTFGFRLVFAILIIGGVRVAWAYVPEDRLEVVREFIEFLEERKLWWMTPIFIVMAFLMILVLLTQTTGGSFPFIYAVF